MHKEAVSLTEENRPDLTTDDKDQVPRNGDGQDYDTGGGPRQGLFHWEGWRLNRYWWWAGGAAVVILIAAMAIGLRMPGPFRSPGTPVPNLPPGKLAVIAFYDEDQELTGPNSLTLLKKNIKRVDVFSPFWYSVDQDGNLKIRIGNSRPVAEQAKLTIMPLVTNAGGNEGPTMDPNVRKHAIQNIVAEVNKNKWAGINIDFQLLSAASRQGLTQFIKDLKAALPRDKKVFVSIIPPAQQSDSSAPYDYKALTSAADGLVLMAYDRHDETSNPGPVAPIDWVEQSIKTVLATGVSPAKLFLGIALYGYDWPAEGGGTAVTMPMKKIEAEKGEDHQFDQASKESYYTYTADDGTQHIVWYEDEMSLPYKIDLVKKYNLPGIACWRVGYEDQNWWDELGKLLGR